jgi:alpha-glucosidase
MYVSPAEPVVGEIVTVRLRVARAYEVEVPLASVHVRYLADAEPRFVEAVVVERSAHDTWWAADLEMHNPVLNYRFILSGGPAGYQWINGTGVHLRDVPDAADFRLVATRTPAWLTEAVVYQIFPDRFARSSVAGDRPTPPWAVPCAWDDTVATTMPEVGTQLYGGDLDGIVERLDYLVDLGITTIYLTPFFPGASNHRYDAETFDRVDPVLGGDEALSRLVRAAHGRGLRVMGDFTTNHTGETHEWFAAARSDPVDPHRDHYYFEPDGRRYATWLGVPSLPKLNYGSRALRDRLFSGEDSVVQRWLRPPYSLDGWRVDVANMSGRMSTDDFYHEVQYLTRQAAVAANPEAAVVAEHCHDISRDVSGLGWHGAMNYSAFTRPIWTWLRDESKAPNFLGSPLMVPHLGGRAVMATMRDFTAQLPWAVVRSSWNLLGSHDTTRIRTLVGTDPSLVAVGAGMLFTMPGVPMFTYGDEIGMRGEWGEDGRRPMQWDAIDDDEGLLAVYRALIRARRDSPALSAGGLRWVHAEDDALVFLREHPQETALVHLARGAHEPVRVPAAWLPGVEGGRAAYGPPVGLPTGAEGEEHVELPADGPVVQVWGWPTSAPGWAERGAS